MKKYILSISFILSFFIGIGQPIVNRSSSVVTVRDSRFAAQYNLVVPNFTDTTSASTQIGIDSAGSIIHTYSEDAFWYRQSFPKKWIKFASSTSGTYVDSVYVIPAVKTDSFYQAKNGDSTLVHIFDRNCGLIDPGVVTYDSLLIFTVSPAVYILCSDGIRRTSVNTDITLAAADPSNPRIDAIILDINGVNKVTGDAAASPAAPSLTPEQILLTYVLVETSATTIPACTVPNITVYDENTGSPEWAVSGTASENPNNTNFPYHLTKSTDVGAFTNGQTVNFLSPAAVRVRDFTSLKFFIRLKSAFAAATSFQVSWVTTAGNSTVNVLNGTYGFNSSVSGSYQPITIPISAFPNPSAGISFQLSIPATISLRITFVGGNANGLYIDYIQLGGNCIEQPPTSGGLTAITGDNGTTASTPSNIQFGSSSSTGSPLLHHTFLYGNSTYTLNLNNIRFEQDQGANIAAANNLTLGLDGNLFTITGNTQINAITTANWQAGSQIALIFASTPTVKHNTAGGAGTSPLLLAGAVDFVASANSVLNFVYDGTNWIETSRKVAAVGGGISITADNGLTASTATNVQLGGSLLQNTTIANSGFVLNITSSIVFANGAALYVTNSGSGGIAIQGESSNGGRGVWGNTTDGFGVVGTAQNTGGYGGFFISAAGNGIYAEGTEGLAGEFRTDGSSTNTVIPIFSLTRSTSGTPAAGIGVSLDLYNQSTVSIQLSNQIISKWTTATDATRTSQFIITKVLSGVTANGFIINGSGVINIPTNTTTYADDAAAVAGGLVQGDVYWTATGQLMRVL